MQLVYYGWASANWNSYLDNTWVLLRNCKVKRSEIKTSYLDNEFWSTYAIYKNWKRFGLPHGAGWLNEHSETIELLNLMQDEIDSCEYDDFLKRKNK